MAKRRRYDSRFKAQIALEAIKNQRTLSEIASDHGVHPNQVSKWKRKLLGEVPEIFSSKRENRQKDDQALQDELYKQIGQLKVELDWLKKSWFDRLRMCACWWNRVILIYPYIVSAN